jgi:putative ABC transport system permease protein
LILLRLAWHSLINRRATAILTIASIALSVFLLLGVEAVRTGARESFTNTISGTDVIVGARTGGVQLLLYSVFRIGDATNNITWKSYEDIAARPEVAWIVPLSLGDSHHGFRVLGTTQTYFDRYKYGHGRGLTFSAGQHFDDLFDTVIGADVARQLGYRVGDNIVVAHGIGSVGLVRHDNKPFRVAGILAPTGTPVDRTLHVSLEAIEAIHADWKQGAPPWPGAEIPADALRQMSLAPQAVTAALIGLKSRLGAFSLQRWVNTYPEEPLTAILPGVALVELWSVVGVAERALLIVSALVVATAFIGLVTAILSSLNERRREMAILRSVGAGPAHVMGLFLAEAVALVFAGMVLGIAALYAGLVLARPLIESATGLYIDIGPPEFRDMLLLAAIAGGGVIAGLVPAIRAYRMSLADGLAIRV